MQPTKVANVSLRHIIYHLRTWLLFHCIQHLFNNILQLWGTDRLHHFHQVFAGFTEEQDKNTLGTKKFYVFSLPLKSLLKETFKALQILYFADINTLDINVTQSKCPTKFWKDLRSL